MPLKLNVGCGGVIRQGWVNIDEFNPTADLRRRIQDIDYPDASVDVIEGMMVLEHLSRADGLEFCAKAYRMLIPGGKLILEVPDLAKVCRLIIELADDVAHLEHGPFGLRGIFGEPTSHMTIGDYHKWGYTPASLRALLKEAGFASISISDGNSHCFPLRDMRGEAIR